MASSRFEESHRGVDEKQECSPSAFPEKADEKSSGCSTNDLSSPLSNDGFTSSVFYKRSTMGAFVNGDTNENQG